MLGLVASSLLLLPWSCWWTEVSEGPAWSLNPLQRQKCAVSSFAPAEATQNLPKYHPQSKHKQESLKEESLKLAGKVEGAQRFRDILGQTSQENHVQEPKAETFTVTTFSFVTNCGLCGAGQALGFQGCCCGRAQCVLPSDSLTSYPERR